MELHIDSRVAAASFEDLIDRVSTGGDTIILERNGRPLAKLISTDPSPAQAGKIMTPEDIAAIQKIFDRGRELDDGWADAVEEAVRIGNLPVIIKDPWDQ